MKYISLIEAVTGIGLLHIIFIFLGTLAYVLDKFLEQYNKALLENKKISFKEFMMEPPTYVGALLTLILAFMASIFLIYEIGTDKPMLTAGLSGATAYGGYALIRQRMKSAEYKQQYRRNNSTGLDDGPNEDAKPE